MSLKEKAIEVYEKEKELRKESETKQVEKFADDALKALIGIIGEECGNITVLSKKLQDINY